MNSVLPTNVRLLRLLPLAVAALLGAYGLVATSGVLGVVLLVAILSFAVGLALWVRGADAAARATIARGATGALLFFPAALVVFFSFSSGGFFPDSVALADIVVAVLLIVRLALADRPLAPFSGVALAPLVGVAGLALWALLSQFWSHAPGRATIAFDRDLLYALTFALFASIGASRDRLTWAIRALALAMTVVVGFGLMSRVAADVLPTALDPAADGRLAYPLTYWNAMGVFCAVTAVLCLHLAATDYRRRVRALAAAALPVIGATLLLTYSRGGLAAAAVGLVAYAVLGRPRGLLSALIATAPATAVAMKAAYDATLVSSADPATPAAVHQGHHVALIVLACVVAAGGLRVLLHGLDRRLDGEDSPIDRYAAALRASAAGALLVAVVVAIALGAPNAIAHRWNQFVDQQTVAVAPVVRTRLSSTSNNGRLALWKIEFHAFDAHPLDGTGADTFEILYYEHRPNTATVVNAHSLYIETLGDLGIVGLVLVLLFVLGTLAGAAPFRRGRDRALYAALFGAGLAWALHAGVDWDWQMPAVSIWFAALGGLALGRPVWRAGSGVSTAHVRAFALGAVVVAAAVLPALVLASQLRLTSATSAYAAGDCASADRFARNSLDALGTRAGPWQIEALCDIRGGQYHHALLALDSGLSVDPNDWQLQSAAAATEAVLGFDARAQAASALRLNPLDSGVMALAHALERGPSKQTRQAALAFLSDQSLIVTG